MKVKALLHPVVLLVFLEWIQDVVDCYQVNYENRLREILFQRSDAAAQALPAVKRNYPVSIKMALDVLHVIKLDEKEQTLIVKGVVRMEWEDIGLRWNKSEFDDVDTITISPNWLWIPDVSLYSSANGEKAVIKGPSLASVRSSGIVNWEPPVTLHQFCSLDMWHYPHDSHECEFKFGSWTQDGFSLKLEALNSSESKFPLDEEIARVSEWDVQISPPIIEVETYLPHPEPYLSLYYKIRLSRRSDFYHYTLLCPLFAILFMANALFWLPPSTAEKTTLGSTICLLLVILICHLMWVLPNNSTQVPALLGVCVSMLFFATLSMIITLITNNLSTKKSIPPSPVIRFGKSRIGRLLGMQVHSGQSTDTNCEPETEPVPSQWPSIAKGIDRICFCVHFIISLVFFGLFYA